MLTTRIFFIKKQEYVRLLTKKEKIFIITIRFMTLPKY
jgi:hypothetical protein